MICLVEIKELINFLKTARKKGHAFEISTSTADDRTVIEDKDGSKTFLFNSGDWQYKDEYSRGEPFGGSEKIFYKGISVWIMNYYGKVSEGEDKEVVYSFLRKALYGVPDAYPFRGPLHFEIGDMEYENSPLGDIEEFSGVNIIFKGGKKIFYIKYVGGLVNQR